ncbi:type 2 lanthipeptide synthetase LanM family protein [Bacillus paramycoides]|uniref:type 2 lanthipeptide synthetase LanM family protein n=1 Tax=Bacillus paramycoides TaxID=2026194 RepID=UPI0031844C68
MQNVLKNSSYINERSINNKQMQENLKLELYWAKFFKNDKSLLAESINAISNISLESLNDYHYSDFSFRLDDEIVDLGSKYFDILGNKKYLEENFEMKIKKSIPFSTFFIPFLELGLSELKDKGISNQNFLDRPLLNLINRLFQISHKTLILEINVKRILANNHELTPEERYNIFLNDSLTDKHYLENFHNEYSVLFRLLLQTVKKWAEYISEIIENTQRDKLDLNLIYNQGNELGAIKGIDLGLGDSHNGKSVVLIEFESGKKIIYKPRSLCIDQQYNELIKFFNSQKATKNNFFEINVLDRKNYGWTEFIEHLGCKKETQVKDFYIRTGNLLALMYILNATDFHHENIIAHSEYPVPIDLESLMHQNFFDFNDGAKNKTAIQKADELIKKSVHSIGMLPHQAFLEKGNKNNVGVDLSGMGAKFEQKSSYKVQKIINLNSDLIRLDKDFFNIKSEKNNPYILGETIKNSDYIEEIKYGFHELYTWVMDHKNIMRNKLEQFNNLETRFILRPTNQYSRLLNQSFHPDFLRNGVTRDLFLHRVNINKPKKNNIDIIVKKEKKDLLNGDIPFFFTKVNEPHLYIDKLNRVDNYFKKSNRELIRSKITHLSKNDLSLQLNIIHMSVLAGDSQYSNESIEINLEKQPDKTILKNDYLKQAVKIGEYILSKAINGKVNNLPDYCWISTIFDGTEESNWRISPTGVDLYNGNAGVAIFLSYLSKLTNRTDFKKASYVSLNSIREQFKNTNPNELVHLGAFDGWAGCLYSMYIIAECWNDSELKEEVYNGVDVINASLKHVEEIDITSGLAGVLGILLSIYKTTDYQNALKGAETCANKIINSSVTIGKGIAWQSPLDNIAYTGFAHGTSGIVSMLARLYTINKDPTLLDTIKKGLCFERGNYVSSQKNWKRSFTDNTFQYSWCHGAPGILLSRLILKDIGYQDNLIDQEILTAISTTLERGVACNHSLCHGNFGQIEILKIASQLIDDTSLNNKIASLTEYVLQDIDLKGMDQLSSKRIETQGLMNGLAGYGYGLLAQSTDIPLPSLLMLGPVNH